MDKNEEYLSRKRPPSKRPKMSIEDRAKQFGAFDPLTGFSKAIRQKELEMEELPSQTGDEIDSTGRKRVRRTERNKNLYSNNDHDA